MDGCTATAVWSSSPSSSRGTSPDTRGSRSSSWETGDLITTLAGIKAAKGLGDRLTLTGRRPVGEIADFIVASDVCLLPSMPSKAMRYVVPSKVDEYLEGGRPVISTPLEGMLTEFRDMTGIIRVHLARRTSGLAWNRVRRQGRGARRMCSLSYHRVCAAHAARREDCGKRATGFVSEPFSRMQPLDTVPGVAPAPERSAARFLSNHPHERQCPS